MLLFKDLVKEFCEPQGSENVKSGWYYPNMQYATVEKVILCEKFYG